MTTTCQSCGAATVTDARFCRRCGAPLRATGQTGGHDQVSAQAATIPLREEGRTTDGLAADDPRRAAPETQRVGRAEMDSILQRAARERGGSDPNATVFQQPGQETSPAIRPDEHTSNSSALPSSASFDEQEFMQTRQAIRPDVDEEATVLVPRPFGGGAAPRPVQRVSTTGPLVAPGAGAMEPTVAIQPSPQPQSVPVRKGSTWKIVVAVCASFLLVAALGTWLAVRFLRKPAEETSAAQVAPVSEDRQKLAAEKVNEAEERLRAQDLNGALTLLREATGLDPNNVRAHRRLGELFRDTSAWREAAAAFGRAASLEPNDFTHWREMARAQLRAGLPADAATSYKRVLDLTGGQDPNDLFPYAESLHLSGRAEEARAVYETLSASPVEAVANDARRRLAELAANTTVEAAPQTNGPREENGPPEDSTTETTDTSATTATQPTPLPQPTAQPTPQRAAELSPDERYRRGLELWPSNRSSALTEFRAAADAGNPNAHYYLGLGYVEGKDLATLKRAEIVAALRHFQVAQAGSHGAQSRRYAQQLEREYDRIRNQR